MTSCVPLDEGGPQLHPRRSWTRSPAGHSEDHLLMRVAGGDRVAYTNLYDQMSPRVFGLCRRLLQSHTDAEDVTQEVFLEVWTKAAQFDPSRGSAVSWMYRMAHHRAVDRIRTAEAARRRDASRQDQPVQQHHEDANQHLFDRVDQNLLGAALQQLSHRRREALLYAFFTEHNYQQASVLLGIPLGTFKSRVRDGLLALRALLIEDH